MTQGMNRNIAQSLHKKNLYNSEKCSFILTGTLISKNVWYANYSSPSLCVSSHYRVTINDVLIRSQLYWTLYHATCNYALQFTITHRLTFSATVFTELLSSGLTRRTFPFLWVPKVSSQPQLPHLSHCLPADSQWTHCTQTLLTLTANSSRPVTYPRQELHREHCFQQFLHFRMGTMLRDGTVTVACL
jgi:hypothetical protein